MLMREVTSQFDASEQAAHGVVQDISYAPVAVATTVASDMLTAIEKQVAAWSKKIFLPR